MASSTSPRASISTPQSPSRCRARAARSTASTPTAPSPPTIPSTMGPARTWTRSGRAGCATPTGPTTTSRRAGCSSATSAGTTTRLPWRKWTSARRAPTTAGPTRRDPAPGSAPARSTATRTTAGTHPSLAGSFITAPSFRAATRAAISSPTTPRTGSGASPWTAAATSPASSTSSQPTAPSTAPTETSSTSPRAPSAVASANPTSGPTPLDVSFSSAGSSDPEGQPLTYSWTFGDGATSTAANPTHTYTQAGQYTARLSVSDGVNSTLSAPITISAGNRPTATILSPTDGSVFQAGDVISFGGDGTDTEDGSLPASAFTWNIDFLHEGHVHPGTPITDVKSGTFTIPTSGHDFSGNTRYRI